MTSVGILGTFLGIWIALLPFDPHPDRIQASIEAMLDGMKTAFFTSVLGLGCGIIARCGWHSPGSGEMLPGEKKMIEGLGGVVAELRLLRAENRQGFEKLDGLAEAIKKALIENLKNLIEEIRTVIVEELSKSMQALIETIDKTMNDTLGKKLGEFNQSVNDLREWQVQHKDIMDNLRTEVGQLISAFREIASGIDKIKQDCAKIPPTMENLRRIVGDVENQIKELEERLAAFAKMKEQAEKAFPTVDARLTQITSAMTNAASTIEGLKNDLETVKGEIKKIVNGMREETQKTVKTIGDDLRKQAGEFAGDLKAHMRSISDAWGSNLLAVARECAEVIKNARGGDRRP